MVQVLPINIYLLVYSTLFVGIIIVTLAFTVLDLDRGGKGRSFFLLSVVILVWLLLMLGTFFPANASLVLDRISRSMIAVPLIHAISFWGFLQYVKKGRWFLYLLFVLGFLTAVLLMFFPAFVSLEATSNGSYVPVRGISNMFFGVYTVVSVIYTAYLFLVGNHSQVIPMPLLFGLNIYNLLMFVFIYIPVAVFRFNLLMPLYIPISLFLIVSWAFGIINRRVYGVPVKLATALWGLSQFLIFWVIYYILSSLVFRDELMLVFIVIITFSLVLVFYFGPYGVLSEFFLNISVKYFYDEKSLIDSLKINLYDIKTIDVVNLIKTYLGYVFLNEKFGFFIFDYDGDLLFEELSNIGSIDVDWVLQSIFENDFSQAQYSNWFNIERDGRTIVVASLRLNRSNVLFLKYESKLDFIAKTHQVVETIFIECEKKWMIDNV